VKLDVLAIEPLVAVTTIVETPVGVPASGGGLWLALLPPPPQPGTTITSVKIRGKNNPRELFRFPTRTKEKSKPIPAIHCAGQ
jgi:hypothetical protein